METKEPADFYNKANTVITLRVYTATIDDATGEIHTSVKQTNNPMWCTEFNITQQHDNLATVIYDAKKLVHDDSADMFLCYPLTQEDLNSSEMHDYRVIYGRYLKTRAPDYYKPIIVQGDATPESRTKALSEACKTTYYDNAFVLVYREDSDCLVDMNIHLVRTDAIYHADHTQPLPDAKTHDDGSVTVLEATVSAQ